jgi:hypothetical protein
MGASSEACGELIDLLVAMGYGGSVEDAGKAVGKSGDGGSCAASCPGAATPAETSRNGAKIQGRTLQLYNRYQGACNLATRSIVGHSSRLAD